MAPIVAHARTRVIAIPTDSRIAMEEVGACGGGRSGQEPAAV
jgi:hypothetical protein